MLNYAKIVIVYRPSRPNDLGPFILYEFFEQQNTI